MGTIDKTVFIAEGARLSGNVNIEEGGSVWYNAVLRASDAEIRIGAGSNIQDNCVLHAEPGRPVHVGRGCTVGHNAIVHGCTVGDNTLIGMGAIVLNDAKIGNNCLIGAGALVTEGTVIPDGSMAFGSPARIRRDLRPEEIEGNRASAKEYVEEARAMKAAGGAVLRKL